MQNHVPTLENCLALDKALKAKGMKPMETMFWWRKWAGEMHLFRDGEIYDGTNGYSFESKEEPDAIPAPLVSEMSSVIGKATQGEYTVIEHDEGAMAFHVYEPIIEGKDLKVTRTGYKLEVISGANLMAETSADTWILLYTYLINNDLISK